VVTESVFNRPGLGRLLVDAILWRDLPLVQGVALVLASTYVLINLLVDVLATFLDPRAGGH
jgi:ABC-type dipeptide/oligopeptide/nickel transport system permease component